MGNESNGGGFLARIRNTLLPSSASRSPAQAELGLVGLEDRLLTENSIESCRARFTQSALAHAAILSEAEEKYNKIAPSGRERYKHLIDTFTVGAANQIARW